MRTAGDPLSRSSSRGLPPKGRDIYAVDPVTETQVSVQLGVGQRIEVDADIEDDDAA